MLAKVLYLLVFLAGLALAVHAMLHGVERWRRRRSTRPSAVLNPPTVAGLAVGIGATGYLLSSRSNFSAASVFLISILVGAAALAGMIVLMAKWALRAPATVHSEEEEINGQVATVTRTISPDQTGEITWQAWGRTHSLPARTDGEDEIAEGTEVVIDTVENGVARVELWSVVEGRL